MASNEQKNIVGQNKIKPQHADLLVKHCKTSHQLSIALIATASRIFAGLTSSIIAVVTTKLKQSEFEFPTSKTDVSTLTNYSALCFILGPLIFTYFIKIIGRKNTLVILMVPLLIQFLGVYFATSLTQLVITISIGFIPNLMVPSILGVYISEITAPHIRCSLNGYIVFMAYFGHLLGMIVLWVVPLKLGCLLFFIASLLFTVGIIFLPESPYFYVQKNQISKAKRVLGYMYDKNIVNDELNRLSRCIAYQNNREISKFFEVFTKSNHRKPFLILLNLFFLKFFSAVTLMPWFSLSLLHEGKYTYLSPIICEIIITILSCVSMFVSSLLLLRIKRKIFCIFLFSGTCFCLFLFVVYFYLKNQKWEFLVEIHDFLPFLLLTVYSILACSSTHTMPYIYYREYVSLDNLINVTFMFDVIVPIFKSSVVSIFNYLRTEFSYEICFGFFFICSSISTLIYIFFTPKTKTDVLEDVYKSFEDEKDKN